MDDDKLEPHEGDGCTKSMLNKTPCGNNLQVRVAPSFGFS